MLNALFSIFNFYFFFQFQVGNKNDDPQKKVVLTEDAQRFAEQMGIQLFETSAKDNLNVEEMFLAITQKVLCHKKHMQSIDQPNDSSKIRIGSTSHEKRNKKGKCCFQ